MYRTRYSWSPNNETLVISIIHSDNTVQPNFTKATNPHMKQRTANNLTWWGKPRNIAILVDNDSWVLPYARELVERLKHSNDNAILYRSAESIPKGCITFLLGCTKIIPQRILNKNIRTLVVHASDLPRGRGFSPLTWRILEGHNRIPICLLDAVDEVDAGPVVYREEMIFQGNELIDELRHEVGTQSINLCLRFLDETIPKDGIPQDGEATIYPRRVPQDSKLDPNLTLIEQFNLLRVVDNEKYPAFFHHLGCTYRITITKDEE